MQRQQAWLLDGKLGLALKMVVVEKEKVAGPCREATGQWDSKWVIQHCRALDHPCAATDEEEEEAGLGREVMEAVGRGQGRW